MMLTPEDIEAIAASVVRKALSPASIEAIAAAVARKMRQEEELRLDCEFAASRLPDLETLRQQSREWIAEKERLDQEILEASKALPAEFRPVPAQYKSIPRKQHVLKLLKDPGRWEEIPRLPVQWPPRR